MVIATQDIGAIVAQQRAFFGSGKTKDVEFRIRQLQTLKTAITDRTEAIMTALKADLNKPQFEAFATEIGVTREINTALKQIRSWVKPQKVATTIDQFPARARLHPEPLGIVLVIAPWNYPFQLLISPLVGAIAAGNCALLKPSELAPHTSRVIAELIESTFDPAYIAVVEGGVETSQAILAQRFDHIFFTGGASVGKIVMTAAAKHLTPVTLELGGKSPCIVDANIPIATAAERIVWGKFINAGQTCVAPDYLLVDRRIKPALIEAMRSTIQKFYGDDPAQSLDYARIITARHFDRLTHYLQGNIVIGGETGPTDRYIAPTVIDRVSPADPIMQEEIFGPILPVIEYEDVQEAIDLINDRPKPLSLYLFSQNKALQNRIVRETASGGVCINDTILQIGGELPFGGVGESGMGSYHGKASFDTFSHPKSVLYRPFWLNFKWRYAPYKGKLDNLKKMI